jgi:hypothetical protein
MRVTGAKSRTNGMSQKTKRRLHKQRFTPQSEYNDKRPPALLMVRIILWTRCGLLHLVSCMLLGKQTKAERITIVVYPKTENPLLIRLESKLSWIVSEKIGPSDGTKKVKVY